MGMVESTKGVCSNDDTQDPKGHTSDVAKQRKVLGRLVSDLNLSVRASNVLKNAGITTLPELTRLSRSDVGVLKHCGPKVLKEIETALGAEGLSLRPEGVDVEQAIAERIRAEMG